MSSIWLTSSSSTLGVLMRSEMSADDRRFREVICLLTISMMSSDKLTSGRAAIPVMLWDSCRMSSGESNMIGCSWACCGVQSFASWWFNAGKLKSKSKAGPQPNSSASFPMVWERIKIYYLIRNFQYFRKLTIWRSFFCGLKFSLIVICCALIAIVGSIWFCCLFLFFFCGRSSGIVRASSMRSISANGFRWACWFCFPFLPFWIEVASWSTCDDWSAIELSLMRNFIWKMFFRLWLDSYQFIS